MDIDQIQILGPQNSGTNLIKNLLTNNLNKQIKVDDGKFIWKHTLCITKLHDIINSNKSKLFICMYRPIIYWINSIKKMSYEIEWDGNIQHHCKFMNITYENIVELYNKFYINYIELLEKYNNIIFVDYYKIIDEDNTYNYLSSKLNSFGLKISSQTVLYKILNTPSKNHGFPVKNAKEANENKIKFDNNINEINNIEINLLLDKRIPMYFEK
jgi:hypothetical protein